MTKPPSGSAMTLNGAGTGGSHDVSSAHVIRELLDSTPIETVRRAAGPRETSPSPVAE